VELSNAIGYALQLEWIKHFDKHIRDRVIGTHRLLVLDGHESYSTPEFDTFYKENNIMTLYIPSHTWHLL
jgi:hypothetical protein